MVLSKLKSPHEAEYSYYQYLETVPILGHCLAITAPAWAKPCTHYKFLFRPWLSRCCLFFQKLPCEELTYFCCWYWLPVLISKALCCFSCLVFYPFRCIYGIYRAILYVLLFMNPYWNHFGFCCFFANVLHCPCCYRLPRLSMPRKFGIALCWDIFSFWGTSPLKGE